MASISLVGFAFFFLRIDDPHAWLLSVLFACFVAIPSFHDLRLFPWPLGALLDAFRSLFGGMLAAMLYTFFAVFPERAPIDRRVPRLRWFALFFGLSQALPGLSTGNFHWPPPTVLL